MEKIPDAGPENPPDQDEEPLSGSIGEGAPDPDAPEQSGVAPGEEAQNVLGEQEALEAEAGAGH